MRRKNQLVIDASCIMSVIKQEATANEVMKKSEGYELVSANCLPFEVLNYLSKWLKRDLMTIEAAKDCFDLFRKIPIKLIEPDFDTCIQIAGEEKHYIYDMFYIDCALRYGYPLLSFDEKLNSIARKRGVVCL